jgi:hypothetical protein
MRVIRWIGASLILPAAIIVIAWAFGAVWFDAPFGDANKRELWFRAQSVSQTNRSLKLGLIAVGRTSSVKRRRKPTGLRQARSRGYDQSLIAEAFFTERILTKSRPTINPTLQKPSEAFKP